MFRNGKDSLLIELAKYGLGKRDLMASVNFFSKVTPDAAGYLSFVQGHSQAGNFVDIRFDMNVLLVVSAAPHPLDPNTTYQPASVKISASRAAAMQRDDVCRNFCEQNARGFINTERYYL